MIGGRKAYRILITIRYRVQIKGEKAAEKFLKVLIEHKGEVYPKSETIHIFLIYRHYFIASLFS
jgi:hypothetical protein